MSEDQVRTYPAGCFGGEARIKILSDPLFSWYSLLIFDEARVDVRPTRPQDGAYSPRQRAARAAPAGE